MYDISNAERAMVLQIVSGVEGVDRTEARIIDRITTLLDLYRVTNVPMEEADEENNYALQTAEVEWLLDQINEWFGDKKVQPLTAGFFLSLETKLKEGLDG